MDHLESVDDLPVWTVKLYQDDEKEKADEERNIKLINADGRKLIWKLCNLFHMSNNMYGYAPQTCHILEKFFLSQTSEEGYNESTRQIVEDHLTLLVSVCLWLSAKMQSNKDFMNGVTIQKILKNNFNKDYTVKEIMAMECKVFEAIDFHIPFWTTVEKALMLSEMLDIKGTSLYLVCGLLNAAEYHRNDIVEDILLIADTTRPRLSWYGIKNVRNLHLAAASIVAYNATNYGIIRCLPRLASIAKVTPDYLQYIAKAILKHTPFEYIQIDKNNNPTEPKRKRPNILKKI